MSTVWRRVLTGTILTFLFICGYRRTSFRTGRVGIEVGFWGDSA
jgi:hypothetical protein